MIPNFGDKQSGRKNRVQKCKKRENHAVGTAVFKYQDREPGSFVYHHHLGETFEISVSFLFVKISKLWMLTSQWKW